MTTQPIDPTQAQTAPHLTLAHVWKDGTTGETWVHKDMIKVAEPWDEESHVPPTAITERFGDVEGWAAYVRDYGPTEKTFATWNSQGLRAVLDYPIPAEEPGRCQWLALHPFTPSIQWRAWLGLANGQPVPQRAAVERLEDLAEDIREPDAAEVTGLLRNLRASVNAKADTELRPDGSTSVSFQRDTTIKAGVASVELPRSLTIAIPVLKGHVGPDGRPVLYRLEVRLRVSVDEAAHLAFRLSIPNAERVLEDVYAERVKLAAALLGPTFRLLRAAD